MRIGLACEVSTPPAEVLDLLGAAGLPVSMLRGETAPALFHPNGVTWFLGSAADVLSGCDRGALDAGVVGSDRLFEGRLGVVDLLDLRRCRDDLVLAVMPSAVHADRRLRVATRHPRAAARHFGATGEQPEILVVDEPLLASSLGMADGVVELGARLRSDVRGAPLLEPRAVVASCSAHLVASRSARVLRRHAFAGLVGRLRVAREEA
ncbi:MAG TPA: hypothetical protein PLB39_02090 [Thermoleophilia bacterium]|nr:hypothetical protein [Acidobacteriota bacterium]HOU28234.1 hypothetical protein [Thermoleophilia bacterium]